MSRRWFGLAVCVAAATLCACGAPGDEPVRFEALGPGTALPERVDAMIYGSASACRADADCPGEICNYGTCAGVVTAESRWMQERIAQTLAARVRAQPELGARVSWHLQRIATRERTELGFRVRALIGLEALEDVAAIKASYPKLPERAAAAAALALCRLGDDAQLAHALALTEAKGVPLAVEALRAVGLSGSAEALSALLGVLVADLDHRLVRAALDGLASLSDPRSISTLVAFLEQAPESLVIRAARTLRDITGAAVPANAERWRAWLKANPQPPAPPFVKRHSDAEEDLGIPTP